MIEGFQCSVFSVQMKHKATRPQYAGRVDAAAPATGLMKRHQVEQVALVDKALSV